MGQCQCPRMGSGRQLRTLSNLRTEPKQLLLKATVSRKLQSVKVTRFSPFKCEGIALVTQQEKFQTSTSTAVLYSVALCRDGLSQA